MTVYVVCGLHRTGTSMMMQGAKAGGMTVTMSLEKEEELRALPDVDGYELNPHGFYEVPDNYHMKPGWSREHEGAVIKVVPVQAAMLCHGDYRVAFMQRPYEEVLASATKLRKAQGTTADHIALNDPETYRECFAMYEGWLKARRDISYLVMHYGNVIQNPVHEFTRLAEAGWPLNPEAAATAVRPELHRHKIGA